MLQDVKRKLLQILFYVGCLDIDNSNNAIDRNGKCSVSIYLLVNIDNNKIFKFPYNAYTANDA